MWVRGLKHLSECPYLVVTKSHPMWVRGLKLQRLSDTHILNRVAPHVGAWIETVHRTQI